MIAQNTTEIARTLEQTIWNLKELESRITTLKNDLGFLSQAVGHHEAARLAFSPQIGIVPGQVPYGSFEGIGLTGNPVGVPQQGGVPFSAPRSPFHSPYSATVGQMPLGPQIVSPFAYPNHFSGTQAWGPRDPSFAFIPLGVGPMTQSPFSNPFVAEPGAPLQPSFFQNPQTVMPYR